MWRRPPEAGRKAENVQKIAKILYCRKPEKVLFSDESNFCSIETQQIYEDQESWAIKSCPLQWASKGIQKDVLGKFQFFSSWFPYASCGMMNLYKYTDVIERKDILDMRKAFPNGGRRFQ